MIRSVLAGFFIGIGATVYLTIGGVVGAVFFSVGLATILIFGFFLFTGKAGLLSTNEIRVWKLCEVWIGNFLGAALCVALLKLTPVAVELSTKATAIVATRNGNPFVANTALGFLCGVLMYSAVTGYKKTESLLYIVLPIVTFIMTGCNHCVADMFYLTIGADEVADFVSLIPTTMGNVIGCNFVPLAIKLTDK